MRDVRTMWMVSLGLACSSPKSSAERSDSSASLPTDTTVSCIPRSMRDDCWYDTDCIGAAQVTGGTLVSSLRRWTFRKSSIRGGGTDAGTYIKVGTRTSWNTSGFVSGRQRVSTDSGGVVDCTFVGRPFHVNTAVQSVTMMWDGHTDRGRSTSFLDFGSIWMAAASLSSGCPVSFASSFTAPVMGLAAWGTVFRAYEFSEIYFRNSMLVSSAGVVTGMGPTSSLEYWEETANVREHGVVTPGAWFVPH